MERECTFAPVIDARSAGMMSHRSIVLKVGSQHEHYQPTERANQEVAGRQPHCSILRG